jgi:hypothetical protein
MDPMSAICSHRCQENAIDIFDGRTKMAIWRGTAMKTLSDNPRRRTAAIDEAVAKTLASFPPRNRRESNAGE